MEEAQPRSLPTTSFISARRTLPDAYYSLMHFGKLDWLVSERMLSLSGTPNELWNVAVMLPLVRSGVELGRCYCRYPIQIEVSSGGVNVLTPLPDFTLTLNGLTLKCGFTIDPPNTEVTWDFGDNTPLVQGLGPEHVYTRSGRYELLTRLAQDGKLVEYRSAVVVSANHPVVAPLVVTPSFSASTVAADGTVTVTVSALTGTPDISLECSAGRARGYADSGPIALKLKPGAYVLNFLATRNLSARFYSKQRYLPAVSLNLTRGRISSNRTSDPSTPISPNELTTHIFGDGSGAISPVDRWTLELPLPENPWFMVVSASDVAEFDCSELDDAVLSLEFLSI
jgi:hypothetical protein